jgi:phosphatidate phosphatase PAH1
MNNKNISKQTFNFYKFVTFQILKDQDGFSLPNGPVFMSPLSFTPAVVEAIRDPSSTKVATLRELIDLFDRKQVRFGSVRVGK